MEWLSYCWLSLPNTYAIGLQTEVVGLGVGGGHFFSLPPVVEGSTHNIEVLVRGKQYPNPKVFINPVKKLKI